MRRVLYILFASVAMGSFAQMTPYMTETRVKDDLDGALSRLIEPDQFLVQVTAKFENRTRRKLIEGETIEDAPFMAQAKEPPEPMPGFVPEATDMTAPTPGKKTRETYENVETSELESIQVGVSFDETISDVTIGHAKRLVTEYLYNRYEKQARLNFYRIPMLASAKKAEASMRNLASEPKEPTFEESAMKWLPWALFGLVLLVLLFRNQKQPVKIRSRASQPQMPFYPFPGYPTLNQNTASGESNRSENSQDSDDLGPKQRSVLLAAVMANASAFRLYYESLAPDEQGEIEGLLAGPAFDNLMTTLVKERAPVNSSMTEPDEAMEKHQSQFEEYVRARQWQEQQLFGFLQQLSHEQIISLVNFESDLNVCLMLRFMKPAQSANVLDNLSHERRLQILTKMNELYEMPLSDIAKAEQQIRAIVKRLPSTTMGPGKQELAFWGDVLNVSNQTPEILQELEETQSRVVDQLQKFKFTLDDAASLPDEYLVRVLSETDNEELCLAMVTCSESVAEVILENVSERRREVLRDQLPSFRNANPDKLQKARINLTKKIREAMA